MVGLLKLCEDYEPHNVKTYQLLTGAQWKITNYRICQSKGSREQLPIEVI